MKPDDLTAAFNNRVKLDEGSPLVPNQCERCYEPLIFALRSENQDFSIGLFTILQCLEVAEYEGAVPKLPDDWWISLQNRYGLSLNYAEYTAMRDKK